MMTVRGIIILVCCVGISLILASPVPNYRDCGSKGAKIISMDITPCETEPCPLVRGKNVSVILQFTTNKEITKINAIVHAILSGVRVPFPLKNPDGCNGAGLTCPLAAGGTYNYTNAIPVSRLYPPIKMVVEWQINDQDGDCIWCFQVPAEVH